MSYLVLGPMQALRGDRPCSLGGPRQRMVLAVLLARANRVVPQDALIDEVWNGEPPGAARATLHGYVSVLRKELGGAIARVGGGYRVDVADDQLDAIRFEQLAAAGRAEVGNDPIRGLALLQEALSMWYGHPYGDLGGAPALSVDVVRLEDLRLVAVEARVEADLAVGNHAAVVGELETLIRENPYRERLRALQMLALYRSGRQTEALRAYERARTLLSEELGIDPSPELRRLEHRILEQDPVLAGRPGVGSAAADPLSTSHRTVEFVRSIRGYELRDRLGGGTRGEVYRAYQPSVGRVVAVKSVDTGLVNRPDFVRRFEASAEQIAALEHPHIVGLYDFWRDPDGAYLVMPYLRGGNLGAELRKGPWNLAPALKLIDEVGRAVGYAHRCGVVHGHLHPNNVLLDDERNAYVTDFGLGFDVSDTLDVGASVSLAYVAPETASNRPFTSRTDIFSLGVLVFHLLTGVDPKVRPVPPLREARLGLPPDLDDVLATATAIECEHRYEKVDDFLRAIRRAVGADVVVIAGDRIPDAAPSTRNPYKGLRSFTEADAGDFRGRSALTNELVEAVISQPLVAVVGPSGSGKSSVVRAGLIPALREAGRAGSIHRLITDMFPGSYPFEELEAALLRVAVAHPPGLLDDLTGDERGLLRVAKQILPADDSGLVLVIDQFEELFSAVASERTRLLFLDSLVAVATDARSRVKVVLTMRADFFDRLLEHRGIGGLIRAGLVPVTPPSREGLAQAIAGPAREVGAELEPGLVGEIIHDVQGQPGALPLLQYALTELFDRRGGNLLTIATYRDLGGVVGALGVHAEEIFGELSVRAQDIARQVFLRLVTVDDLAGDTRRRVRLPELKGLAVDQGGLDEVLQRFGMFRLLSYDRDPVTRTPTVEVAHEALLKEWQRLADWIDAERENLLARRRITTATRDWSGSGADASFLLRGGRLEQTEEWVEKTDTALSGDESEYLSASRSQWDTEVRSATRRRRRVVAVLAIGFVLALAGGLIAVVQRNQAKRAESAQLAQLLAARALLEPNLELSLLLARQAVEIADTPDTRGSLLSVLLREPRAIAVMHGRSEDSLLREVAVSPDGRTVAVADQFGGAVLLFDATTFEAVGERIVVSAAIEALAYSPGGEHLAVGGSGYVALLDARTRQEIAAVRSGPLSTRFTATQVLFTQDGSRLITVETEAGDSVGPAWITIRDAFTLEPIGPAIRPAGFEGSWVSQQRAVPTVALTPDGRSLIVASSEDNVIEWWDITSGERTRTIEVEGDYGGYRALALSPDGSTVAVGLARGFALIDAATGTTVHTPASDASFPIGLLFSPDGSTVVTTNLDGTVTLWTASDATIVEALDGHSRAVWHPAFSPDGAILYTPGYDGSAIAWDMSGSRQLVQHLFRFTDDVGFRSWPYVHPGAMSPDGELIAVGLQGRGIGIWDAVDLSENTTLLDTDGPVSRLAFGSDGRTLISISEGPDDAVVTVWDVEARVARMGPVRVASSLLGVSADGSLLAISGAAGGVELRRVDTGMVVGRIGEGRRFDAAAFGLGGVLVTTDDRSRVDVWDIDDQLVRSTLSDRIGSSPVGWTVAVSRDGTMVAIGGLNPLVRIWDLATGELVRSIEQDVGTAVSGLEFDPAGTTLAMAGGDGFASLWDVATGVRIGPRLTVGGREAMLDVSADGSRLLMTLGNGQGVIWDIAQASWATRACALAGRRLTRVEWHEYLDGRPYEPACEESQQT